MPPPGRCTRMSSSACRTSPPPPGRFLSPDRRGGHPEERMDAPIGVFDSGVGGLTVLRALLARLPHEHTIYLGDTARVPYGTRSREVVTRYALLCGRYLAAQGIKMLVVACNTVSADSLPTLAEALPIPVVGVIEPGAQAAAARTRGGAIAVLGTPATVASGAYQAALRRLAPLSAGVPPAGPLFLPPAPGGWTGRGGSPPGAGRFPGEVAAARGH